MVSLENGAITPKTLACPVGGNQWKPLGQWPAFESFLDRQHDENLKPPPLPPRRRGWNPLGWLWRWVANPRLPTMANWIWLYCLGIVPEVAILSHLATGVGSGTPPESKAYMLQCTWDILLLLVDIPVVILLVTGGLQLKRLRASAASVLKAGFAASLGVAGFKILGTALTNSVKAAIAPLPPVDFPKWGLALVLLLLAGYVACIVFEISSLVWLHRHAKELPIDVLR